MEQTFKIGTRGSPLAMTQARLVQEALAMHHPALQTTIIPLKTTGDRLQDQSLSTAGGKGLFTKEIEEALINKDIDCAVHSMKDMPTNLPDGLVIDCVLPRADAHDVLLSPYGITIGDLPHGATVGTASFRREVFLKEARPDLNIILFRGNVNTRLQKLKDGVVDATILAAAGLLRLERADLLEGMLPVHTMIPAVAQGIIGIEIREKDTDARQYLRPIHDAVTMLQCLAERTFLHEMDGSCRTPIAGYMTAPEDGTNAVTFYAMIADIDGTHMRTHTIQSSVTTKEDAVDLGLEMAAHFKNQLS